MKKAKITAMMLCLLLAAGLAACGDEKFSPEESESERIEELERELEELREENEALKAERENREPSEESEETEEGGEFFGAPEEVEESAGKQMSEVENLLKTTVEGPETSGVCGADLTWYYQNGVLAIKGTGEMTDYEEKKRPWYDIREKIGWVIFDNGASGVGRNAFYKLETLSNVVLPDTLTGIGEGAFSGCGNLQKIVFPGRVTEIGDGAFSGCGITEFTFRGDAPDGLDLVWDQKDEMSEAPAAADGYEPTEEEILRRRGEYQLIPMTIYYSGDTFDAYIASYPYWEEFGVKWIRR